MKRTLVRASFLFVAFAAAAYTASAYGQTLRVVTYNVEADTSGSNPNTGAGLQTVLQGFENLSMNGTAKRVDVLALQELHYDNPSISQTLPYIISQLDALYGAGVYAYDSLVGATSGDLTGNGPNGLIYNTQTVDVVAHVQVGSASGSGAPRAPVRYTLKPKNGPANSQFYLYVSHAKSGTDASDATRRNGEATSIRGNANGLGVDAHVVYSGDWNINGSSEQTYQTLISGTLFSGVGQAIDTANPANNWADTSSFKPLLSFSPTGIRYRDDLQLITDPMRKLPGMQLLTNTLQVFGNNGSINYNTSVNQVGNTALPGLPNRSNVLSALTTVTDHLPVLADYIYVPPGDFTRDQHVNAADIPAMIAALTNTQSFKTTNLLNDHQLQLIGDVNGDNKFNAADLQSLVTFIQTGSGTEGTVPEPATIVLLALAAPALAMLARNRRRASAV